MKIGIVGDLHIAPVPEKRIDDYFNTGLYKVEEIAKNCNYVIFLGDIFSKPRVEESYVIQLISHFIYCSSKYGTKFYSIVGNHDVDHEEESNLSNSSLGVLSASKALTLILPESPVKIGNFTFNTIPVKFSNAVEYFNSRLQNYYYSSTDVLLVHHLYETGNECFTYDDFKNLGCRSIFLGHDHKPFDQGRIIYPEFTVYRSGSIMRNRAEDYNFTRTLYYYIFNSETGVVSCMAVPTTPADKVFKVEAINKLEYQEKQYTEALDKLIDKYENNIGVQDKFSLKKILTEQLNVEDEYITYYDKKYQSINEIFV